MSEEIAWTLNVNVPNGPRFSSSDRATVDAYDVIDVTVPDGAADLEAAVQPGTADQVRFLMVSSTRYGEDLTFKVNDASADEVKLDAPVVLIGEGAVSLLGADPQSLLLGNGLGEEVTVTVLVGRQAI